MRLCCCATARSRLSPRDELVVRDEAMRFHSVEARQGGELIVFDEQENFVVRSFAAVVCRQKNFRSIVRIAPAQIFVAKEGFELVVERSDFGASDLVGKGKYDVPSVYLRTEMAMLRRDAQVPRPNAIGSPEVAKSTMKCASAREKNRCDGAAEIAGEFFG